MSSGYDSRRMSPGYDEGCLRCPGWGVGGRGASIVATDRNNVEEGPSDVPQSTVSCEEIDSIMLTAQSRLVKIGPRVQDPLITRDLSALVGVRATCPGHQQRTGDDLSIDHRIMIVWDTSTDQRVFKILLSGVRIGAMTIRGNKWSVWYPDCDILEVLSGRTSEGPAVARKELDRILRSAAEVAMRCLRKPPEPPGISTSQILGPTVQSGSASVLGHAETRERPAKNTRRTRHASRNTSVGCVEVVEKSLLVHRHGLAIGDSAQIRDFVAGSEELSEAIKKMDHWAKSRNLV